MLRNFILLGVMAGTFAAIPAVLQGNPQAVEAVLRRLLAQEPPRPTAAVVPTSRRGQALAGRKVRIAADSRGHYAAEFRFNGRNIRAMVDTGATLVAVNESTARRIGLKLSRSDFRHRVNTANGPAPAAVATIDDLRIDRILVREVQAVVLKDDALAGTLVGMSFLNRLSRFGVEDGMLLLEQ
ncbi:TIGR02281 family clan AA aspartic protease [Chelativorans intermedius]|uniref:TIGR02281 family clan AA aspartic protease n=1 Tax=Chelativorans intermedius TaxID=515947 RepID=A0ABV6DD81_9HYPH|nr:TIGR02281 family clan AA aspartic protease [Chelativorans intermedius]MCT8998316.1 TIGR02281 family clan AA aspartic protease [Chelativorans intermedius]